MITLLQFLITLKQLVTLSNGTILKFWRAARLMTVKLKSLLNGLVIKFGETEKEKQMFFPLDYTVLLS